MPRSDRHDDDLAVLTRDWARAVAPSAYTPTTAAELEPPLRAHLDSLHAALLARPFRPDAGYAVGLGMIVLHLTKPEAVEATLVVLADRLLPALDLDAGVFGGQLARLLGALAHGYARALGQRARADQEAMFRAALIAVGRSGPVR